MNWSERYASESSWSCVFCGGPNHRLKTSSTFENSDEEGRFNRSTISTSPLMYPESAKNYQDKWRRRVKLPWSTRLLTEQESSGNGYNLSQEGRLVAAPAQDPDRERRVRTENRCPMCKKTFSPTDQAVRFTGPHQAVQSDHFPFHEDCMSDTTTFCPHMMGYEDEFKAFQAGGSSENFERGDYKTLRANADKQSQDMNLWYEVDLDKKPAEEQ